MGVSPTVKVRTLRFARGMTPIDTGNLRYNATKLTKRKANSWTINYSLKDAYYIEILEDGVLNGEKTSREPRKFIQRTSLEIALYLRNLLQGKPTSGFSNRTISNANNNKEDNNERKIRHFESLVRKGNTKWR